MNYGTNDPNADLVAIDAVLEDIHRALEAIEQVTTAPGEPSAPGEDAMQIPEYLIIDSLEAHLERTCGPVVDLNTGVEGDLVYEPCYEDLPELDNRIPYGFEHLPKELQARLLQRRRGVNCWLQSPLRPDQLGTRIAPLK